MVDIAEPGIPHLLAAFGIDGNGVIIQGVIEDFALGVGRATIDHVTAGDALSRGGGLGLIAPLDRGARLGKVESIEDVRKGGNDLHRLMDYKRRGFVSTQHTSRECPGGSERHDVVGVDLV